MTGAGIDGMPPEGAVHAYLVTSPEHEFHNRALERRHARLEERRPRLERRAPAREPRAAPAVEAADAIVGPGNRIVMDTWAAASRAPAYPFNNFGWSGTPRLVAGQGLRRRPPPLPVLRQRQPDDEGPGPAAGGVPRHPELHLHVCSDFAAEPTSATSTARSCSTRQTCIRWASYLRRRAASTSSRRCAWAILPSCSEGQGGLGGAVHARRAGSRDHPRDRDR